MEPVSMENNQSAIHAVHQSTVYKSLSPVHRTLVQLTFIQTFYMRVEKQGRILIAVWAAEFEVPEELQGDVTLFWD